MEKLLHERLRAAIDEANSEGVEDVDVYVGNVQVSLYLNGAQALADEIERYYIPRTRFEDGEPVQFGEEFESRNDGNKYTVNFIGRGSNGVGRVASCKNGCGMTAEEPLKRPTPKVYDADGVEIKVGDTVYFIDHDLDWKVVRIVDGLVDVERETGSYSNAKKPSLFTHERPVFDAEGVRICKGDTVWPNYGAYADVKSHVLDVLGHDNVLVAVGCAGYERFDGKYLTHREPDSIQRVRDYARKLADDGAYNEDELYEIADRLTALIERGA